MDKTKLALDAIEFYKKHKKAIALMDKDMMKFVVHQHLVMKDYPLQEICKVMDISEEKGIFFAVESKKLMTKHSR